ncbi:epithelial-stromal interaction protein 1 isoform X2 [Trachinotus anak]|uniref:epithelial-stromal interaction protein 1 isoform X2 n=1 Tax=Trachinotus anak TaxID=443729 RepID=UPI0039F1C109
MPATKVIKPKPVEATGKPAEKTKPVPLKAVNGAGRELRVPAVRNGRASSCPRCPRRDRCDRATASRPSCESRRARSISAAPKPTPHWPKTNPDKPPTGSGRRGAVNPQSQETSSGPGQRQQRSVRAETSHKAFTVIPPNPKKRREIQRKAEAELAALEELRLSRAMAYVSINPSSVGGCMSLEEVRLKQQQEMMQAKRKQKPMKRQVMEQTPVLMS